MTKPEIQHPQNTSPLSWGGTLAMAGKEWRQLRRDKALLTTLLILPLAQMWIMGLAIQNDLRHVPAYVYNDDGHNPSLELVKALQASTAFAPVLQDKRIHNQQDVIQAVREGRYRLGLMIPPDYSRNVLRGSPNGGLRVVVDGTNANISKTLLQSLKETLKHSMGTSDLLASVSSEMGLNENNPDDGPLSPLVLSNPDLSAPLFLIPGILGIIMHILTVMLCSFSIVREREAGTLEPLLVSPLKTGDLMLGKLLPYAAIGLLDMTLTLVLMVWFFSIPIEGSFWFLSLASTVFIFTSLGLGLLFSTLCKSQLQAVQLTFALLLPSLMLSGFVFPVEPMPLAIRWISQMLPLTYYLDVIRGVVIKGLGAQQLWPQTLVLFGFFLVFSLVSVLRFRKECAS